MMRKTIRCSACGAPSSPGTEQCPYCDNWFDVPSDHKQSSSRVPQISLAPDFGFSGWIPLVAGVFLTGALYGTGWYFEDTEYWLADEAIAIWAVALPLWLGFLAFFWKASWGGLMTGFFLCIPMFLIHMLVIWFMDRRINDDGVGISAMFAGAALGGWLLGRGLHRIVRISRAKRSMLS